MNKISELAKIIKPIVLTYPAFNSFLNKDPVNAPKPPMIAPIMQVTVTSQKTELPSGNTEATLVEIILLLAMFITDVIKSHSKNTPSAPDKKDLPAG